MKSLSALTVGIIACLNSEVDAKWGTSRNGVLGRRGTMYRTQQRQNNMVREIKARIKTEVTLNPETYWFDAKIDHFTNHGAGSATYPMRYLIDKTYY